jgi:hypothetical protein
MNGLGIKLTAIISDEFVVECVDPVENLWFSQRATNELGRLDPQVIAPVSKKQLKGMTTCVPSVFRSFVIFGSNTA